MKRYRWTSFYIDTMRNALGDQRAIDHAKEYVAQNHGQIDTENKYIRWLELEPPALCAPVEWHDLLREVEFSYIHGDFYPALTSACCLGERILNHLVINLRDYFKDSPRYKEVHAKESFQDWNRSIDILSEWNVLNDEQTGLFNELLELRNPAIHFGNLEELQEKAKEAINLVYSITSKMFGQVSGHFFICPGEFYVSSNETEIPLVKEFIIPHCHLVGYKHRIEPRNGEPTIVDDEVYDDQPLSDEEFIGLRTAWRNEFR